jgi:hypothetical protein
MPKFIVKAKETVFYWKEVEARSETEVRRLIECHDIEFEMNDISDDADFRILEIEKENANA